MMELPYHISILNEVFTHAEIADVAAKKLQQELSDWEREFYVFVLEWFNQNDFVEVKTSGSTGQPKTIRLPKLAMRKSAERTIQYFNLKENDRLLLSLSCRYIAGKMMVVRALTGKMNLLVVDPACDFRFLDQEKFDFGAMVPLQVGNILETGTGKNRIENIRHLLVGGSAAPFQLEKKIRQLKNNVVSTYGMTETASHIAVRKLSGADWSENYRCLPGISIRKNENECLEIFAEGQPEWLTTTDLVDIVSFSEFKILGRADHVIISGGLKFHPELIEKKLEKFIHQPFIISSEPDEKLGRKLVLMVEAPASGNLKDELRKILEKYLAKYEKPRKIAFVKPLPRNANGKIIRK
ncbi:MAG: AMP-binding protein [Prolixibacteraceae bacterium]|jgi:O-succinylbenzoic acid--CoA ligase|nr:AMP-binding protein [Prolixibacteraceae bacterium]